MSDTDPAIYQVDALHLPNIKRLRARIDPVVDEMTANEIVHVAARMLVNENPLDRHKSDNILTDAWMEVCAAGGGQPRLAFKVAYVTYNDYIYALVYTESVKLLSAFEEDVWVRKLPHWDEADLSEEERSSRYLLHEHLLSPEVINDGLTWTHRQYVPLLDKHLRSIIRNVDIDMRRVCRMAAINHATFEVGDMIILETVVAALREVFDKLYRETDPITIDMILERSPE